MSARDREILKATGEASRILRNHTLENRTSFDIIGTINNLGIPLLFRPLNGLLGASIKVNDEYGMVVTSQRDLHVQRFTLAHELGHILMQHNMSLDLTVDVAGRYSPSNRPDNEIAADTFASELLAPRSIMMASANRHGWTKNLLKFPENIYQLSLRLGISFKATCWALATQNVLSNVEAKRIQDLVVKDIKHSMAPEEYLSNSWANVWSIKKEDSGTFIEAGPDDVFAVHLNDNSSAGYLWELVDAKSAKILEQHSDVKGTFGENASKVVYLRFDGPGTHRLSFEHVRPWNKQSIEHIDFEIDSNGKELDGFSRQTKKIALETVVA